MNTNERQSLGSLIKRFRKEAEMNQAQLAAAANLSPGYISELEGESATRPSGEVLMALADALGVTIADLLDRQPKGPARTQGVDPALAKFAKRRKLPKADVEMLLSIQFRGERPKTERRWEAIYDTIRMSSMLDDDDA